MKTSGNIMYDNSPFMPQSGEDNIFNKISGEPLDLSLESIMEVIRELQTFNYVKYNGVEQLGLTFQTFKLSQCVLNMLPNSIAALPFDSINSVGLENEIPRNSGVLFIFKKSRTRAQCFFFSGVGIFAIFVDVTQPTQYKKWELLQPCKINQIPTFSSVYSPPYSGISQLDMSFDSRVVTLSGPGLLANQLENNATLQIINDLPIPLQPPRQLDIHYYSYVGLINVHIGPQIISITNISSTTIPANTKLGILLTWNANGDGIIA